MKKKSRRETSEDNGSKDGGNWESGCISEMELIVSGDVQSVRSEGEGSFLGL